MCLRDKLESMGWPDGRSLSPELKKEVTEATSFLQSDVKLSQRLFCIYADLGHAPKCPVCGGDNKYSRKKLYPDNIFGGWSLYCSKECTYKSEDRDQKFLSSMLANHGVRYSGESKELLKKSQDTLERKIGKRFALQDEGSMKKFMNTMNTRYGGRFTLESPTLRPIALGTNFIRYGNVYPIATPTVKEKAIASTIESVGVYPPSKALPVARKISVALSSDEAVEILESKDSLSDLFNRFGKVTAHVAEFLDIDPSTVNKYLRKYGIDPSTSIDSRGEREVAEFIESLGIRVVRQGVLEGKKIDILIPEHMIAIEYNGVYFHSTKFRDKNYHKERTALCSRNGYRLFHIWEDEWDCPVRQSIWKTKLATSLKKYEGDRVFARNTVVRECRFKDISTLMNETHIQGAATGTVYFGCFLGDVPVAAMVMKSKGDREWELSRFCSKGMVIGGFF